LIAGICERIFTQDGARFQGLVKVPLLAFAGSVGIQHFWIQDLGLVRLMLLVPDSLDAMDTRCVNNII